MVLAFGTLLACGDASSPQKGSESGVPTDGKTDFAGLKDHGSSIQEHSEIGVLLDARLRAHAWTVTLGTQERVSIFSGIYSGEPNAKPIDTVLYLYKRQADGGWGRYIERNDDISEDDQFSRIDKMLAPGDYRIIVKGYDDTQRGWLGMNLQCADGRCERYAPLPPSEEPEEPGTGTPDQPGAGAVSFRIPLLNDSNQLLSSFNAELTAAGLLTFPDYVRVSSTSSAPAADWDAYVAKASEEAVAELTGEIKQYGGPDDYMQHDEVGTIGLCYTGNGSRLADFMQGFSDQIFSDQFVVGGWRAGSRSAYLDWHEPTAGEDIYGEWNAFDPTGTDVMVVFSTDDNGTPQTVMIPRCN